VRGVSSLGRSALLVGCALAVTAAGARSQDIEAVARMRGISLPAGYYQRVQQDPTAFRLPNGLFRATASGRVASRSVGTARLPIVLALFADSQEPHITRDMIQASLFDGPSERGTITEAYQEMSRGAITVTGDVLPWVRTSLDMVTVVGTGNGLGQDAKTGEYFTEALAGIDPDVDFGQYDSDGPDGIPNSGDDDGIVDVITFEFLEVAASCGGPAIWPHRWGMSGWNGSAYETDDLSANGGPIKIDGYITQSVADCSGLNVQSANVISHEFGHVLGLPDYYHPTAAGGASGRRWVLGCWSLMAAGSWGCGPVDDGSTPFGPTHMVARSKQVLGWLDYTEIGEVWNEEVFLDPVQSSGKALRLPMGDAGTEFLIAEYRTKTGFDAQIPAEGVLFYKQDLNASLRPDPATSAPYFLTLLEQDSNRGLLRNAFEFGNRGEAGDAWGVNGVSRKLHSVTAPQLLLSNGLASTVTVHEVAVVDGRARLVVSTGRVPKLIPPPAPLAVTQVSSFAEFTRIAGGRQPYVAFGEAPDGVVLSAQGDELLIGGSVRGSGPFELTIKVRDAAGLESNEIVVLLTAEEWMVSVDELLQAFLDTDVQQLSIGELDYLDFIGNGNGKYDVGDLRKFMREGSPGG
jgi:M6 family metalloprotease-like protein